MSNSVVSARAEAASVLLFNTLGAHRVTVAGMQTRQAGRLGLVTPFDAEQIQCQATLVRLLSITESFTAELMTSTIDSAVSRAASVSVNKIWEDAAIRGTDSWSAQRGAYKAWLGVKLDWGVAEQLSEARNAVAHGLGSLTRRQLRNQESVRAKLKAAGIDVQGDIIILSDAALASAAAACRDLIHRVDLATQGRPTEFR